MIIQCSDGYHYDDNEGLDKGYCFRCQLDPETYHKLLMIAHENGILTFDINTALLYVIRNFPRKN